MTSFASLVERPQRISTLPRRCTFCRVSGELLGALRNRFVLLASGEGQAENIGESWRVANSLGDKGVPNRIDSWGADWHHDWATWRRMFPQYLEELTR